MQIKTFRAKSIQEALQLVRDKLGPDACVLQTREVRGLIGRRLIEVDASGQSFAVNRIAEAWPGSESRSSDTKSLAPNQSPSHSGSLADPAEPSIASQLLDAELQGHDTPEATLKQGIAVSTAEAVMAEGESFKNRDGESNNPPAFDFPSLAAREIWNDLLHSGAEPTMAASLLNQAVQRCAADFRNDAWLVRGQLNHLISQQLKVAAPAEHPPNQQRMLALVGPTGVGKTTLLGKIATQAYREGGLQIGIVTLDTWRGGSVERLLELAELVEAEVEIVGSMEQLAPALQRLREFDLVLIDTAGRSPNDSQQMENLQELLHIAQPDETHLVLSCTASQTYAQNAICRFHEAGATRLCITKLDEGGGLGQWISPLWNCQLPIQHLTFSQDVQSELMTVNARHLASIILGQASLVQAEPSPAR